MNLSPRLLIATLSIAAAACSSSSSGTGPHDGGSNPDGSSSGKDGSGPALDGGGDSTVKEGGSTPDGGSDGGSDGASDGGGDSTTGGDAGVTPILGGLNTITTIGSTIDPNNDVAIDPTGSSTNPYGLAIAPVSAGPISAGDLVICNFNNGPNTVQ
ncbi:MAG TPA: hypothetical protein VIY73_08745, partial [Polyangiaceae bacterium]